jgi:tripeptide aminopeptidase
MQIDVRGIASHAGGAPERGVSAIAIAALGIANLHQNGWHGDIRKDGRQGTSNVGYIRGGEATNVVTDQVVVKAEARSHDPRFRQVIVEHIKKAFRDACQSTTNAAGKRGRVRFEGQLDYEAFMLAPDEPCLLVAEKAVASVGRRPERAVTNGGLDANWMVARGIPTVTLGCGQVNQHTVNERLRVCCFEDACRIALRLATATEG